MDGLEFKGVDELEQTLRDAAEKYPDIAEDVLKKEQKDFKKRMEKETWSAVEKHTGNLVKGFRFSKIEMVRGDMETNFMAEGGKKNPHFHLINNGHEMVTPVSKNGKKVKGGGKTVGFVPGRRIKEPVIEQWKSEHKERSERMLEKICQEANK